MASWFDNLRDKAVDAGMAKAKQPYGDWENKLRREAGAEAIKAKGDEQRLAQVKKLASTARPESHQEAAMTAEQLDDLANRAPESPQEQQLRQMLEESHKNPETPEEAAAWEKANEEFPSEWNLTPEQEEHLRRHGSVRTTEGDRYTDWYMRETSKDLDDYWGKQLGEKLQKREPKHPEWNEPAREKL
jgi:hypothetical protein